MPSLLCYGLTVKWLKGASGAPIVLNQSAFDAAAVPRERIGVGEMSMQLPFFKESTYVDEELRQVLNSVIDSQNQAYVDILLRNIFDDKINLLRGARAQRERLRMLALTTGAVVVTSNGQVYEYDYMMPDEHKVTVAKSWSDPKADIMADLRAAREIILTDTGATLARAITSSKVFGYFRNNEAIRASLKPLTSGVGFISDESIRQFIKDELEIEVVTNDKIYATHKKQNGKNVTSRFVPDDVFVMFPSGQLGETCMGTTPEQSDLMTSNAANVTIADVGVAVTTITKPDPVNVETKVSMVCMPSFPLANQVFIYDVVAAA